MLTDGFKQITGPFEAQNHRSAQYRYLKQIPHDFLCTGKQDLNGFLHNNYRLSIFSFLRNEIKIVKKNNCSRG